MASYMSIFQIKWECKSFSIWMCCDPSVYMFIIQLPKKSKFSIEKNTLIDTARIQVNKMLVLIKFYRAFFIASLLKCNYTISQTFMTFKKFIRIFAYWPYKFSTICKILGILFIIMQIAWQAISKEHQMYFI